MRRLPLVVVLFVASIPVLAQPTDPNALYVRVVDVGAGLCCVVKMPGGFYMVYDAGNGVTRPFKGVSDVIPDGEEIDLMILSHPDSDHLGAVKKICDEYKVRRVIRTGYERADIATWVQADTAVRTEVVTDGCRDINLRDHDMPPGATYFFGETHVTIISGYHGPPADWGLTADNEKRNSISIVARLVYKGKSILFCGDTVGREIGAAETENIAAEKVMVDRATIIPIKSDVMIAPHHGADNGSSKAFIEAVSPDFVVFSAGNLYSHPRQAVADRYLALPGLTASKLFRTDRNDADEGVLEWSHASIDGADDDDVEIVIKADGTIEVEYR